ncbi:MAG TPA: VOC family protein [Chitinophagaceae bacterium]
MSTELVKIIPVLESSDIDRDVKWYKEKTGFELSFLHEKMYAGLNRDGFEIHLQWHAGTKDDPMNGGAVIRIDVKYIKPLFEEFKRRGTVKEEDLRQNTPWGTNEFAFHDLNSNAIFISEDI